MQRYRLELFGPFGLFDPTGKRVELTSKRGMALMALLATARGGTRSRGWLQDMLWGSRHPAQAQASLRRELSNLRKSVNAKSDHLLQTGFGRVTLDCDLVAVASPENANLADFLEGLDIDGEEAFEDWLRLQRSVTRPTTASTPRASPPVADNDFLRRAAVAVLPFANLTDNRGHDYLAQAAADDLIDGLSRLRWLPVIARTTSSTYSTDSKSIQEIGTELGAGYIVEGRLRGHGERLSLAATICDTHHGRLLWSRRADFGGIPTPEDVAAFVAEVTGGLAGQLDSAEMNRAATLPAAPLDVADILWRARWHHNQYTREDGKIAEKLFEEAIEKAPHSPEAIIQYALFRQRQLWLDRRPREDIRRLRSLAQRAIASDYSDGRGYMVAGIADLWLRETASAIRLFKQAISLNPSLAYAYGQLGAAYYLNNEPAKALDAINRALRLDVGEVYGFYIQTEIGMARAMLGDWAGAIEAADHAISRRPRYWYAHVVKIHALMAWRRRPSAVAAAQSLLEVRPTFEPSFIDWVPFADAQWNARLVAHVTDAIAG